MNKKSNETSGQKALSEDESPNLKQAKIYFEKSKELHKKGKSKKALRLLNKSIITDLNNPNIFGYYCVKILWLRRMKKYREESKVYDDLIKLYPNDSSFYLHKAEILTLKLKNYELALDVINKGLTIDPKNQTLLIRKVELLKYLGRFEEILDVLLAENMPENPNSNQMYI